jgi:pre-mRNA-processing factor 19
MILLHNSFILMSLPTMRAVSGEVPEDPVRSPVSGCVFERRLIAKHLADNTTDPISGEALELDQLISIKGWF